jgi:hypothetical protein
LTVSLDARNIDAEAYLGLASNLPTPHEASLPYLTSPPTVPDLDPDADLTRSMAQRIARCRPASGADALRELRAAFPETPLALRVAALRLAMRYGSTRPRFRFGR